MPACDDLLVRLNSKCPALQHVVRSIRPHDIDHEALELAVREPLCEEAIVIAMHGLASRAAAVGSVPSTCWVCSWMYADNLGSVVTMTVSPYLLLPLNDSAG